MKGLWFDGPTDGVPVEVTPLGTAMRVVDTDGRERGEMPYTGAAITIGGNDGCHLVLTLGERALYVERAGLLPALESVAPDWFVTQVRALQTERRVRWATSRTLYLAGSSVVLALVVLLLVNLHALAVAAVPAQWEQSIGRELWPSTGDETDVDPAVRTFVERTTRRLDEAHRRQLAARGESSPYEIHVKVVRSKVVNAFALPGGYVTVNEGLIAAAASPEEVAGIIAHELGHVAGRHTVKSAVRELGTWALLLFLFDPGTALMQLQPLVSLASHKNSRDQESEADAFGVRLLHAAGVDPSGLGTFFGRLAADDGPGATGPLMLLSTHPASAERAAALRGLVDELPPLPRGEPLCPVDEWARIKAAAAN